MAPLLQEIEQRWTNIVIQVRQQFLAVPSKLASRHAQLKTPGETFEVAMRLVREVLNLLAANAEKATELPVATNGATGGPKPGDSSTRFGSETSATGNHIRSPAGGQRGEDHDAEA